jgi:flagellar motor switch protein FliN
VSDQGTSKTTAKVATPEPQAASFGELTDSMTTGVTTAPLDTLLDISLPVSIEFGRAQMTVQEVLELGTGSVIQLERMVGEPIDIFVSDQKLGEGEVVVIGEHFGVRITRIFSTTLAGSPGQG